MLLSTSFCIEFQYPKFLVCHLIILQIVLKKYQIYHALILNSLFIIKFEVSE